MQDVPCPKTPRHPRPRRASPIQAFQRAQFATTASAFNVLVSAHDAAWETDQLMRMPADRFKEYTTSVPFTDAVTLDRAESLAALEPLPTLLVYESCVGGAAGDVVRFGTLSGLRHVDGELVFRFVEEARLSRAVLEALADRLDITPWELNRTHWAIKIGGLPSELLRRMQPAYDVVLSFAGEQRPYVERVAAHLAKHGVRVFYDGFEEAALWGKDLVEHLDAIYRRSGTYCVLFISAAYRDKMWTLHERRAAFARAIEQRTDYLLPARFDDAELPGLRPTVGYVNLSNKTPAALAKLLRAKLGRP